MTTLHSFVIRGDICYSTSPQIVETVDNGYVVCEAGRCAGVFRELPQIDCTGSLVVPGLVDRHVHAPQYAFRGLGMDLELLKQQGVFVAHCPASNTNLSSGIAPIRRFLAEGVHVGLGSDVAGGTHTSIFRAMADAIQVSKLRWRLVDDTLPATEAFYLGTAGGGAFFGKVGTFAAGWEFDAIVLDDSRYTPAGELSLMDRLERSIYLCDERDLRHKFVQGRQLF